MGDDRTQSNAAATEAAIEALRAQSVRLQTMADAFADMGHATAETLRSRARQIAPPPPVSTQLRRFVGQLARKAASTIALFTDEQRTRIGALIPGFTQAALSNEPDVVAMVMAWIDLEPADLARSLVTSLDDLERRFAS